MRLGKLRHTITIEQCSESRDADGSVIESWTEYATLQASIEPVAGREYFAAQTVQADVTHRIYCRYVAGVRPKMRVRYGSRIFDIVSAINVRERNVELVLMCRESV